MTIDKPTPGNLIATVSELVTAANTGGGGGAVPITVGMFAQVANMVVPLSSGPVPVIFDAHLDDSPDMSIAGQQTITFINAGIYTINLDATWVLAGGDSSFRQVWLATTMIGSDTALLPLLVPSFPGIQRTVVSGTDDISQNISMVVYISAGSSFDVNAQNSDPTNAGDLSINLTISKLF